MWSHGNINYSLGSMVNSWLSLPRIKLVLRIAFKVFFYPKVVQNHDEYQLNYIGI